jgi:hypothetical protein
MTYIFTSEILMLMIKEKEVTQYYLWIFMHHSANSLLQRVWYQNPLFYITNIAIVSTVHFWR